MQKWQHTWVGVTTTAKGELTTTVHGKELDHAGVADYIEKLGNEGWEMVGAAPAMKSRVETDYIESGPVRIAIPETTGYVLWFKRPRGEGAA